MMDKLSARTPSASRSALSAFKFPPTPLSAGAKAGIKKLALRALLWAVLLALLWASFAGWHTIRQCYPPFSLRYHTPLSGQSAYAARQYSVRQGGDVFWPTFWNQQKTSVKSELAETSVSCLYYSGDAALVWGADLVQGACPGAADTAGCAVSRALAWRLWGSTDVVGKQLEIDGVSCTVRGVFAGDTEIALASVGLEDTTRQWNAVELSGGPAAATQADAANYATAAGLGQPDTVLEGNSVSFVAKALLSLPLLVLGARLLAHLWRRLRHRLPPSARGIALFLALLLLTLLLPRLLAVLPPSIVPGRWSDFSHWTALWGQWMENLRAFLGTVPYARDIAGKLLLIQQALLGFSTMVCALLLGRTKAEPPTQPLIIEGADS